MIGADDANPFTREIMEIFRFETPTADRFESALSDMENIVDSDEWRREAKFSADNRGRYPADAVVRTRPVPKMLCPLFYLRVRSQEPKHNVLNHGYKGSYGGERRQSMVG